MQGSGPHLLSQQSLVVISSLVDRTPPAEEEDEIPLNFSQTLMQNPPLVT